MQQTPPSFLRPAASFRQLSDDALQALLREDVPYGDLTTEALGIGGEEGIATFSARRSLVACATEEAARLFELCGARAQIFAPSGMELAPQADLLAARGSACALLAAWKVAQNVVEYCSGIATAAARLVAAARSAGFDVPVACTRKGFPGTRFLASKAVVAGGATLHRLGLSESLLIFPEHRVFIGERGSARDWVMRLSGREREHRLTVEVLSVEEALAFAVRGAEALQLERFSPPQVAECKAALASAKLRPLLLAAGGVTEVNAADYARAGADVLVSSAPYQAAPADVRVVVRKLPAGGA